MDKIKTNIIFVIAVIILIISGSIYLYLGQKESDDIKTGFIQGKIAYDKIENYTDGIMLAKKDGANLIIDVNDKVIEKIDADATEIKILYGGYYSYQIGGKIYLNRNGKNIKTFDTLFQEEFNLYKDENDEKALYITLNSKKITDDMYYVTISNDSTIKSYVYNAKTGKKLYEADDYISMLKLPSDKEYKYFVVGDKELVRIEDFKSIFKQTDITIVGDTTRLSTDDDTVSNNQKYLVISSKTADEEQQKYGLIDLDGNIIIPVSYDDMFFKTDNTRYIVAKKDGKYGIISSTNEELLPFNYNAIEVYDNNIVLVKDNYLGIMDNELKLIYNYELRLTDQEYNSRICCGNKNSFEVFKNDNNLIITTFPKNKDDNDGKTFNNTLILNKKNEITELKKQTIKYVYDEDNVINKKYLVKENIDDKTLSLDIYDTDGTKLTTYETIVSDQINSVSYELNNENFLVINIYDQEYKTLYKSIINTTSGKVLAEDNETTNFIKKQELLDGYYFSGKDNNITIKDINDKLLMNIDGKDIIYLKDNYFAVKNKNKKYYICKVLLDEQAK
ncbi:MAG TPA: WG repeat-containing protein [Bacilli bacterium]|nr:WG repeat-containing protein [Bacilli bacterium]